MARKNTAAPAAPAARKPRESAAAKKARLAAEAEAAAPVAAEAAPPVIEALAASVEQAEAERVAERVAAAQGAMGAVAVQFEALTTTLDSLDDDGARGAADAMIEAARAVRRALNVRKVSGEVGPRSPKDPTLCRFQAVHPDGEVLAGSNYAASTKRDVSVARKRLKDGEGRPGDERLAECTVVDTQAVAAG